MIFDKRYNQWNIVGVIEVSATQKEILNLRSSGVEGKFELRNMKFVPCNVRDIISYIAKNRMWDTAKLVAYWTLSYNRSIDKTIINNAIKKAK